MAKRKTKCHHCSRYMVVVYEMHEACTNPVCDYTYSYAFDIPEGMEDYVDCMCVPHNHILGCSKYEPVKLP